MKNNLSFIFSLLTLLSGTIYFFSVFFGILPRYKEQEYFEPKIVLLDLFFNFDQEPIVNAPWGAVTYNGTNVLTMRPEREYSPGFEKWIRKKGDSQRLALLANFTYFDNNDLSPRQLVLQAFDKSGNAIYWRGEQLKNLNTLPGQWSNFQTSLSVPDSLFLNRDSVLIKCYVWNQSKTWFYLENLCFKLYNE